jgi:hypothetical protein
MWFIWLRIGTVADCCEHSNEPSGYIKFLTRLYKRIIALKMTVFWVVQISQIITISTVVRPSCYNNAYLVHNIANVRCRHLSRIPPPGWTADTIFSCNSEQKSRSVASNFDMTCLWPYWKLLFLEACLNALRDTPHRTLWSAKWRS